MAAPENVTISIVACNSLARLWHGHHWRDATDYRFAVVDQRDGRIGRRQPMFRRSCSCAVSKHFFMDTRSAIPKSMLPIWSELHVWFPVHLTCAWLASSGFLRRPGTFLCSHKQATSLFFSGI